MLVDTTNAAAGSTVIGAIRQAASATGISFDYLAATAQVESGFNPHAGTATTSARGLFQFIDQTWLATLKDAGQGLGYGRYAAAITKTASGRYMVQDPALRAEIFGLRNDPSANALMAGAFTKANAATLTARLGRAPSEGELYLAHFLGAGGAARLITLGATHPDVKAADIFPHAARANGSIFYDSSGNARTIAQVRNVLATRYDVARSGSPQPAATTQAADETALGPPAIAAASDPAGVTFAFAAATPALRLDDGPVFHGLFHDHGRRTPVAPVVSQLWGAGNAAQPAAVKSAASPATLQSTLDLFKDPSPNPGPPSAGKS